ncbi:MAG: epoxyqueuosine reductase [Deltaproteobacteria bacterium]|nr:epoxyqueuosine reductase [Candidatus Zymogenaceae bacterium]
MDIHDLTAVITDFVRTDTRNRLPNGGYPIYDDPLVGAAAADDPIFCEYKQEGIVGPHHFLPTDWLESAQTVISYFLPFSEPIVESNEAPGPPSDEWYLARYWGEVFNDALRGYLRDHIESSGGSAVAPIIDERFESLFGVTSNWSERHAAYAAGLGTFCLTYSFITEKGCAGRFGSVVTDLALTLTPRTAVSLMENCIYDNDGACGICIQRCPAGAVTPEKKDHGLCLQYLLDEVLTNYPPRHGNIHAGGCGKCQTAVPCSRTNPRRSRASGG